MMVTVFLRIFRKKWIKSHEDYEKWIPEIFLNDEIGSTPKGYEGGKCRSRFCPCTKTYNDLCPGPGYSIMGESKTAGENPLMSVRVLLQSSGAKKYP